MIIGYLLTGIVFAVLAVVLSLISGFGVLGAILAYVLGGALGMVLFGVLHLLQRDPCVAPGLSYKADTCTEV